MGRIFLLSPADCSGKRAQLVCNPGASFELAVRLRSAQGAPLGEVFAFLSGLYFRGKLAYARAFARPPERFAGVAVITAGDGLQPADQPITLEDLERYRDVPIELKEPRYRLPLERDIERLAGRLDSQTEVVLLGSIATPKYLEVLATAFGTRVRIPQQFIGLGDMSRGALLLRSVAAGRELEYIAAADIQPRRAGR